MVLIVFKARVFYLCDFERLIEVFRAWPVGSFAGDHFRWLVAKH